MAGRSRPDPQQYALDFQSKEDERRYLLRACRFKTGTRYLKVRFLLELIANEGKDGELAWPRAELAQRMSLSESGVSDCVKDACYLGVLTAEEQWRGDGSQAPNRLQIQWTGLVKFLPGRSDGSLQLPPSRRHGGDEVRTRGEGQRSRPRAASPSADPGLRTATRGSDFAEGGLRTAAPLRKQLSSSSQEVTSSPSSFRSWNEKERRRISRRLYATGMKCVRQAIFTAQAGGLSPDYVDAMVDHFESIRSRFREYSVGALYAAIGHADPEASPDTPFVGVPESVRRRAHEERAQQARAEQRRQEARRREEREAEDVAREQLEARYGPLLDALPPAERQTLVDEVLGDFHKDMLRRDPRSAIVRELLLEAMRDRQAVSQGDQS